MLHVSLIPERRHILWCCKPRTLVCKYTSICVNTKTIVLVFCIASKDRKYFPGFLFTNFFEHNFDSHASERPCTCLLGCPTHLRSTPLRHRNFEACLCKVSPHTTHHIDSLRSSFGRASNFHFDVHNFCLFELPCHGSRVICE